MCDFFYHFSTIQNNFILYKSISFVLFGKLAGSSPKVAVNILPEKRDSSIIRRPKRKKSF
ncbi:hypothetical protein LFML04_0020 [Leptospirillum ferriphilum ML-04]|uniref:Uncharacterized protein n=1 Tax=Leptospirillum ferriphilum (strain ML-04) TaxID=1048260 RepID=J9Z7A8_LEPFM|nr:hypothetical protein LFML04_0020 [Leptospirillum ferriphilum ML-04]